MYNLDTEKIRSFTPQELKEYICECEKDFADSLEFIASVVASRQSVRLCGLAGPSCAGKTTGSFKLTVYLASRGISVRTLSIDDFFHNRDEGPLCDDGKPDYESISYVNLDLLQTTLCDILKGKRVILPKYNFPEGRRIDNYQEYAPEKNEIIILEGLHALNDIMYEHIPHEEYYRIFINTQGELNVDGTPLFSGRELRLFRRLIRDYKFRAADAQLTFMLWENVIKGETKYIHPFENRADFKLNSMFEYEPCAVKRQVLNVLDGLDRGSMYYSFACGLRQKLEKIPEICESYVPVNSLMQEFLGGDYFKYD